MDFYHKLLLLYRQYSLLSHYIPTMMFRSTLCTNMLLFAMLTSRLSTPVTAFVPSSVKSQRPAFALGVAKEAPLFGT